MAPFAAAAAPEPAVPAADDSAVLVSLYQQQIKIYPRAVRGVFMRWRWAMVWATQLLFYGLPWVSWNGRQSVLFDLEARRFYLGPMVLYPQDFIYLTGLLVVCALALFLFTAVAGRLWCGFACPQTVYTELFMWIERRLEGDRVARMRLDAGAWNLNKVWRKSAKHAVWIAVGLWTGFTFVGYFTPIQTLVAEARQLSFGPWEWFWVLFYGFATYGNAGFLREQVCKYMCPYARFQGAMFDQDTMIVAYDTQRGEPRGARSRKADPVKLGLGSCIDCTLCVQVCPTGIDIRQGLQYECIGCAACIDVCDGVMDKMGYARGLIRYDTQNGVRLNLQGAQLWRRVLRPRVLVYSAVLLLICAALTISLLTRAPFRVDVVRDRASLGRVVDDGRVENLYRLQVMNATEAPQSYRIGVDGLPGIRAVGGAGVEVGAAQAVWVTLAVQVPALTARQAGPGAHRIHFDIERVAAGAGAGAGAGAAALPSIHLSEPSTFVVPR